MSADQARQPAGVPTGGQFATTQRTEAGVALAPERKTVVGVSTLAELNTFGVQPLPQWPTDLPEPTIAYAWDTDGQLEVTLDSGPESFVVFGTPTDPHCTVDELAEDFEHLDDTVKDQVRAYGVRLHDNIHTLANQYIYTAHTPQVRHAIVDMATGGDGRELIPDGPDDPTWVAPADRGAARAEENLKAWFGTRQVDETTIQDTLTDLLHLARSKGISPADFGGILHRAQRIYRDELENPEG